MERAYLDHNATTPLRTEARVAMLKAMDVLGNPSSVHAEGRAAKALMERARSDISEALGAEEADIVFTSGATEAAALACADRGLAAAGIEHDAVQAWCPRELKTDAFGRVDIAHPELSAVQLANSETGIVQTVPAGIAVCDMTQAFGKLPLNFNQTGARMGLISAHKLGGPKGIGALVLRRGQEVPALIKGGGQEMGRRSGTENLIGIAGFAAAAKAAAADVVAGHWAEIEELRKILENTLAADAKTTIFVGKGASRLPNTLCLATPGWKGEAQVIQMDLSGFAISAGSACSSGKVQASTVLKAMGHDDTTASSAIRVSLGLETTKDQVVRFAQTWLQKRDKFYARAA